MGPGERGAERVRMEPGETCHNDKRAGVMGMGGRYKDEGGMRGEEEMGRFAPTGLISCKSSARISPR